MTRRQPLTSHLSPPHNGRVPAPRLEPLGAVNPREGQVQRHVPHPEISLSHFQPPNGTVGGRRRVPKPSEGRVRLASRRALPIPVKVRDNKSQRPPPSSLLPPPSSLLPPPSRTASALVHLASLWFFSGVQHVCAVIRRCQVDTKSPTGN